MKKKDKNRKLEDLFRKEFSGYEFEPSPGFRTMFERRLRAKEFMRFNPGRFNVYYLTLAVASAILAVSLLFSAPGKQDSKTDFPAEKPLAVEITGITAGSQAAKDNPENGRKIARGSREASGRITTVATPAHESTAAQAKPDTGNALKAAAGIVATGNLDNIVKETNIETGRLLRQPPSSVFRASVLSGCLPLTVTFENLSQNYDTCIWEFGDGGYSSLDNPVWVFDEKGEYTVTLVTFGENGLNAVSREIISVYPKPEARFEVSAGDILIPGEEVIFYNYSSNSVSWDWDFGDGSHSSSFEPTHHYDRPGSYTVRLVAKSEFGCIDSMSLVNAFDDNSCYIRFPNAFIPNEGGPTGGYYTNRSDEHEEVFHPVWSGVTQYQMRIFSRMGILVFETNDIDIGWDGYIKGKKAGPGVYIWKVRGQFKNGDPFVQAGDVTILPKR